MARRRNLNFNAQPRGPIDDERGLASGRNRRGPRFSSGGTANSRGTAKAPKFSLNDQAVPFAERLRAQRKGKLGDYNLTHRNSKPMAFLEALRAQRGGQVEAGTATAADASVQAATSPVKGAGIPPRDPRTPSPVVATMRRRRKRRYGGPKDGRPTV